MKETDGGLQAVKLELRKHAEQQSSEALKEGELEAERILSQGRSQAKQVVAQAQEQANEQARQESMRVSGSRLAATKLVAKAREQAIEKLLEGLLERLSQDASPRNSPKSGYEKLFAKLAKAGLKEIEGAVIRCRKQDAALAKKTGARLGEPISCAGGLVAESPDGRVRLDATFEALLEEHRDELGKKAFELLFEKKAQGER